MKRLIFVGGVVASVAAAVGCGGGGSSSKTPTSAATAAVTSAATTAAKTAVASPGTKTTAAATSAATPAVTAVSSAPAASTPAPLPTTQSGSTASGKTYNETQAKTLVTDAALLPGDLTKLGAGDWHIGTDTTTDNAAAAVTDPRGGASFERCGRLLGRTVTDTPKDVVTAFIQGESVTAFSTITVYATEGGAIDCATEAAVRFQEPGEFARAFGSAFVDPNAVVVALVDYPQVADGSFAATLTGKVNAAGTVVDITILVVGFRKGNVSAAVGTAHSAGSIPTSELTPFVNLMLQRIGADQ